MTEPEQLVTVYVVNGTRTSAGPGPGPKQLPAAEANALVSSTYAIYGNQPPQDARYQPAMLVTPVATDRQTAVSN